MDASVLIWAKDVPYPIEHARSFWNWLDGEINAGRIVTPKRIYEEVVEKRDQMDALANWMKARKGNGLYQRPTTEANKLLQRIGDYVFTKYKARHAMIFSRGADAWLIAQAWDDKGVVVTQESDEKPEAQVVRIPDVCKHFGVKCVTLNQLFGLLNASF